MLLLNDYGCGYYKMKKLLPLILLILIGCSEPEPKDKLYNEESFKEDILLFKLNISSFKPWKAS